MIDELSDELKLSWHSLVLISLQEVWAFGISGPRNCLKISLSSKYFCHQKYNEVGDSIKKFFFGPIQLSHELTRRIPTSHVEGGWENFRACSLSKLITNVTN